MFDHLWHSTPFPGARFLIISLYEAGRRSLRNPVARSFASELDNNHLVHCENAQNEKKDLEQMMFDAAIEVAIISLNH